MYRQPPLNDTFVEIENRSTSLDFYLAQNRLKTTHRHVHYNNRQAVANYQANRQTTDPNRCLTKNGNDNTRRSVAANATRVVAIMIQIEGKPDKPAPMQF